MLLILSCISSSLCCIYVDSVLFIVKLIKLLFFRLFCYRISDSGEIKIFNRTVIHALLHNGSHADNTRHLSRHICIGWLHLQHDEVGSINTQQLKCFGCCLRITERRNCAVVSTVSHGTSPKDVTITTACPRKNAPPPSIMVQYLKYLSNITKIFTTEFSTHLYIVCKNS